MLCKFSQCCDLNSSSYYILATILLTTDEVGHCDGHYFFSIVHIHIQMSHYAISLGAGHNTLWEVLKKYLKGTPKCSSIVIPRYLSSIELCKHNNAEVILNQYGGGVLNTG